VPVLRLLIRFSFQKKPSAVSRPKPTAKPLPGSNATKPAPSIPAASATPVNTSAAKSKVPPAPPRNNAPPPPPPPPPPAQPQVPQYRAKFAFEGQEGEMSLAKDDIVELVEKDDNGWWLVKKNGVEGWAPNNYLELVPPAAAPPPPPPAPPRRAPAPKSAPTSAATSVTANANAKPVSVFPGMAAANGSATPWKKSQAPSDDSSPASSRPSSSLASKPPPPIANKPKPPALGAKPSVAPKVGAKPAIPTAPRPTPAAPAGRAAVAARPSAPGQVDLAAAVSLNIIVQLSVIN